MKVLRSSWVFWLIRFSWYLQVAHIMNNCIVPCWCHCASSCAHPFFVDQCRRVLPCIPIHDWQFYNHHFLWMSLVFAQEYLRSSVFCCCQCSFLFWIQFTQIHIFLNFDEMYWSFLISYIWKNWFTVKLQFKAGLRRCMRGSHTLSVDNTVSSPLLAFLNQMAPIARFIDKFVPLLHAQQEHMSGGR